MIQAGKVALDYMRGAGWSWFGTWFVAGALALVGAAMGARRPGALLLADKRAARAEEREEEPLGPAKPLTPAPTT